MKKATHPAQPTAMPEGGIYFFWGDEDYTKNARAEEMKNALFSGDRDAMKMNCREFFFGDGEFDADSLSDALLAPSFMSPMKFVSITCSSVDSLRGRGKAAQENGEEDADASGPKKGGKNLLLDYLKALPDLSGDTVLVVKAVSGGFDGGSAKKPSAFLREAGKFMTVEEFPYQTESRLARWLERHFASRGIPAAPDVCPWIVHTAGPGMYALLGEVGKVAAYAFARCEREGVTPCVTLADAMATVAPNDEDEAFGMADSVMAGDSAAALRVLRIKMSKKEEPMLILGQISSVLSSLYAASCFAADGKSAAEMASALKMNEYYAQRCYRTASRRSPERCAKALRLCLAADRQMKSGAVAGSQAYAPLERLLCLLADVSSRESR